MPGKDEKRELFDEILEMLLMQEEDGEVITEEQVARYEHFDHDFSFALIGEMASLGLLEKAEGGRVALSEKGRRQAVVLARRHRLAERLLVDVLGVEDELIESNACHFEHILSGEVADSICTLLGHPKTCPHGRSIPPGECCRHAEQEVLPLLKPLSHLSPGDEGEVAYISTRFHQRLSRLASLGISPGQRIRVRQVKPSFVICFGETELALEGKVADEIYLRVPANGKKKFAST